MWKYPKFILGLLLIYGSAIGFISMVNGDVQKSQMEIVEGGVDTVGVIERRTETLVAGRVGRVPGMGKYYTLHYSYTAENGKSYGGEVDVPKEAALAAKDGGPITIRYYNEYPSIHRATEFEGYMTEEYAQKVPVAQMAPGMVLFMALGLWLAIRNGLRIKQDFEGMLPERESQSAAAVERAKNRTVRASGKPMFGG